MSRRQISHFRRLASDRRKHAFSAGHSSALMEMLEPRLLLNGSALPAVELTYFDPIDRTAMVANDADIHLHFNKVMDAGMLNDSTISVVGSTSGVHTCYYSLSGTDFTQLTIDPEVDFTPGETVTVTIDETVQSADGATMQADAQFAFETIDITPVPVDVSGTITSSTTWQSDTVYRITSDVTIPDGVTVNVQPGAIIKFQASTGNRANLYVQGNLNFTGGAFDVRPVFTSTYDDLYGGDTDGDGDATSPSAGNWGFVKYTNTSNILHDAVFRYGGVRTNQGHDPYQIWVSGSASDAQMEIRDVSIDHAYSRAIYADANQAPDIHDNRISYSQYGVMATVADIQNNVISHQTHQAVQITGETTIDGDPFQARVSDNTFLRNNRGLYIDGSTEFDVTGNLFRDNTWLIHQGGSRPNFTGNLFGENVNSVLEVGGTIQEHTTWDMPMVYLVTSDVTIPDAQTLSIAPGTVVKFNAVTGDGGNRRKIFVNGTLDLQSSPGNEIVFTSSRDDEYGGDSNGDGSSTSPYNEDWGYIKYSNSDNVLHDAIFRYGGLGRRWWNYGSHTTEAYQVWVQGSAGATELEIRDTLFEHTDSTTIYVESGQNPYIHDNTIRGSQTGIQATVATVEDNIIEDFTSYGVYMTGTRDIAGVIDEALISGNTFRGNDWALYFTGGGKPTVTGNSFQDNTWSIHQAHGDPTYSGNSFTGNTNNVIAVSGSLSQDVHWENVQNLNMPYLLTGDVTIPTGLTLSIAPGRVVKFNAVTGDGGNRRKMFVNGTLDLQSSPGNEIVFTSSRDDEYGGDSNGDLGATSPYNEDWGYIKYSNSDNVLHDAIFRYGGLGRRWYNYGSHTTETHQVWVQGSAGATELEIRDTLFEHTDTTTIYVESGHNPWIHDNIIRNSQTGIQATVATVENNLFDNLSSYGVYMTGTRETAGVVVDAVIDGNTFQDSNWGLYFTGTGLPTVTDNAFLNNTWSIHQAAGDPWYSGNVFAGNTNNVIAVSGSLTQTVTWEDVQGLHMPYLVTGDVTIPSGKLLNIAPDVVVKFNAVTGDGGNRRKMFIDGVLNLQSTPGHEIVFTSSRDDEYGGDSNGDLGATSPYNEDWGYLKYSNSENVIHDAIFRYGGLGRRWYNYGSHTTETYQVWLQGSAGATEMEIRDTIFENTDTIAVYVEGGHNPYIHENTFRNGQTGIQGTLATVADNHFENLTSYAVYLVGTRDVAGTKEDAVVTGNRFEENNWALYFTGTGNPEIADNEFVQNTYSVYQGPSGPVYGNNLFVENTYPSIVVGGTFGQDVIWPNMGVPYQVKDDIVIPDGITLTIGPDVVVKFNPVTGTSGHRRKITVNGTLDLQSSPGHEIVFTSLRDDVYGGDSNADGAASTPENGEWGYLRYNNSDNVVHDAIFRYGGVGRRWYSYGAHESEPYMIWASGNADGQELEIRDTLFENAYRQTIYAEAGQMPHIHDNILRDSRYGINATVATVENNTIQNMLDYGVYMTGTRDVAGTVYEAVVQNNTFRNNNWAAYFHGTGKPTVAGNLFDANTWSVYQGPGDPAYSNNTFVDNTYDVIVVGGTIGQDVVWEDVQDLAMPYLVNGDLTVPAGKTLTIDPDIVVKFNPVTGTGGHRRKMLVSGTLDLQSTPGHEIVFTSFRDDVYGGDSNNDGFASTPERGEWGYLRYYNDDNVLHDAIFRYGGVGRRWYSYGNHESEPYMIWVDGPAGDTELEIRDTVMEEFYRHGIYARGDAQPDIHHNTLRNGRVGYNGSVGTLRYNDISDMADYGMYLSGTASIGGLTYNAILEGNTLQNNNWGLYLTGSGNPIVARNTFQDNTWLIYQGATDPAYSENVFTNNTYDAIAVGGTIAQNTTWENVQGLNMPYLVTSDVTINAGVTLGIAEDMVVKFQHVTGTGGNRRKITVNGQLDLQSSPGHEIVFTSFRDDEYGGDTNADNGASTPENGEWGYLRYNNPDNEVHDTIFRYGGVGRRWYHYGNKESEPYMLWLAGSAGETEMTVRNSTFENAYRQAIRAEAGQNPTIDGNVFTGNQYGVYLLSQGSPTLSNNTFQQNSIPVYQGVANVTWDDNQFLDNTYRRVELGGTLTNTVTTWTDPGVAYVVTGDVTVPTDKSLLIDGGVVVKFNGSRRMTVQGSLVTVQNGAPVTFTSYRDDAWYGDSDNSDGSTGNPGDWAGIYFTGQDNIFDQAVVRFAGININGPAVTVRRSEFQKFSSPAIRLQGGGEGSTVHQTNFLPDNNTYYGIQNDNAAYTLPAENNYWNDTDDTGPSGAGSGNGCAVSDFVSYIPWRATPADISWVGPSITSTPNNFAVQAIPYAYDDDNRPDTANPVTWTKVQGPDEFSIHPTTGEIIWVPDAPGDYVLIASAVDDEGARDHIWQVHVGPFAEADPPNIVYYDYEIESMGGSAARAIITAEFNEGVQIRPIDVAIMDGQGQTVTLSSISYDILGKELTVVAENLLPNEPYTFQLMDTITDDMGNLLDGDFDGFTFPTGDDVAGGDFIASFLTDMSAVTGRHIFYNNSAFDGDAEASANDDQAIAPDKAALLPGESASFANYTSYSGGINGIMVDLENTIDAAFGFMVGNSPDPNADWTAAPAPAEIAVRPGDGTDGADRYTITWDNNHIQKQWLQVTVQGTNALGRVTTDVFYFGNAIGESGLVHGDSRVTISDMLVARANPRSFINPADITFGYDYNRDGNVNAADQLIARYHTTNYLTALKLLETPALEETVLATTSYSAPPVERGGEAESSDGVLSQEQTLAPMPAVQTSADSQAVPDATAQPNETPVFLSANPFGEAGGLLASAASQSSTPSGQVVPASSTEVAENDAGLLAGQDAFAAPSLLGTTWDSPTQLIEPISLRTAQRGLTETRLSDEHLFEPIDSVLDEGATTGQHLSAERMRITPSDQQGLAGNVFHVQPHDVVALGEADLLTDRQVVLTENVFQEL